MTFLFVHSIMGATESTGRLVGEKRTIVELFDRVYYGQTVRSNRGRSERRCPAAAGPPG